MTWSQCRRQRASETIAGKCISLSSSWVLSILFRSVRSWSCWQILVGMCRNPKKTAIHEVCSSLPRDDDSCMLMCMLMCTRCMNFPISWAQFEQNYRSMGTEFGVQRASQRFLRKYWLLLRKSCISIRSSGSFQNVSHLLHQ